MRENMTACCFYLIPKQYRIKVNFCEENILATKLTEKNHFIQAKLEFDLNLKLFFC